jgi:ribosomal protein L7/L12
MKIEMYADAPYQTIQLTPAQDIILRAVLSPNILTHMSNGMRVSIQAPVRKVDAIKYLRMEYDLGLYEAKRIIDYLHDNIYSKPYAYGLTGLETIKVDCSTKA